MALVSLCACGVPTGGPPSTIETESVPYGLLREQQAPTGTRRETPGAKTIRRQIALIDGNASAWLVNRDVAAGGPVRVAGSLLEELQRGPTEAERRAGFDSAVSAGVRLEITGWRSGVLSVDVSGEENPATDRLPLSVAQVVLTVTSVPEVRGVLFEHEDTSVQVPRVDGSLTSAPLTRRDYTNLLVHASAATTPATTN